MTLAIMLPRPRENTAIRHSRSPALAVRLLAQGAVGAQSLSYQVDERADLRASVPPFAVHDVDGTGRRLMFLENSPEVTGPHIRRDLVRQHPSDAESA
jgi:hypothetical protein